VINACKKYGLSKKESLFAILWQSINHGKVWLLIANFDIILQKIIRRKIYGYCVHDNGLTENFSVDA
jgi:hypothetical protein